MALVNEALSLAKMAVNHLKRIHTEQRMANIIRISEISCKQHILDNDRLSKIDSMIADYVDDVVKEKENKK